LDYTSLFNAGLDTDYGVGVFFEQIVESLYSAICVQGDAIIDGGVSHGLHTFNMARIAGPAGQVIGFEAIPELAIEAAENASSLELYNIKVINKAISDHIGNTTFTHVKLYDGYSGIRQREAIPEEALSTIEKIDVEVTTIDHELATLESQPRLRFIKLDLEGGEFHALRGAINTLLLHEPFVVFEHGRQQCASTYEYSPEDWFNLFKTVDYSLYDLFGRPFTIDNWHQAYIPWYFIAVKRSIDHEFIAAKLPDMLNLLYSKIYSH